jgi:hypothetical protein
MSLNDLQGQAAGLHAKRPRVRESQTRHWSIMHAQLCGEAGWSECDLRFTRKPWHCDSTGLTATPSHALKKAVSSAFSSSRRFRTLRGVYTFVRRASYCKAIIRAHIAHGRFGFSTAEGSVWDRPD